MWKLFSLLWHQNQILWSNQRHHNGSGTIKHTIWNMQTGQWTVLLHATTFPTLGKPSNMYSCALHQECNQYRIQLLSTATQNHNNTPPYTDHSRCMDTHHTTPSSFGHHLASYAQKKPMTTIPVRRPLHILKLPTACSATSSHFYLPPRYESPVLNINVSLDMANLQTVNITTLHFHVWQHMGKNHNETQLQHLADIPSVPVHKVYKHLLNNSLCMTPFNMKLPGDTNTLWNMFTRPAVYISA